MAVLLTDAKRTEVEVRRELRKLPDICQGHAESRREHTIENLLDNLDRRRIRWDWRSASLVCPRTIGLPDEHLHKLAQEILDACILQSLKGCFFQFEKHRPPTTLPSVVQRGIGLQVMDLHVVTANLRDDVHDCVTTFGNLLLLGSLAYQRCAAGKFFLCLTILLRPFQLHNCTLHGADKVSDGLVHFVDVFLQCLHRILGVQSLELGGLIGYGLESLQLVVESRRRSFGEVRVAIFLRVGGGCAGLVMVHLYDHIRELVGGPFMNVPKTQNSPLHDGNLKDHLHRIGTLLSNGRLRPSRFNQSLAFRHHLGVLDFHAANKPARDR